MNLLTRSQFRKLFNNSKPGLGDWDSPLWIPEENTNRKSRHFVSIPPIPEDDYSKFRLWCQKNCRGQVLCYSIDDTDKEAWYGFTHKPDIVWFIMRWS